MGALIVTTPDDATQRGRCPDAPAAASEPPPRCRAKEAAAAPTTSGRAARASLSGIFFRSAPQPADRTARGGVPRGEVRGVAARATRAAPSPPGGNDQPLPEKQADLGRSCSTRQVKSSQVESSKVSQAWRRPEGMRRRSESMVTPGGHEATLGEHGDARRAYDHAAGRWWWGQGWAARRWWSNAGSRLPSIAGGASSDDHPPRERAERQRLGCEAPQVLRARIMRRGGADARRGDERASAARGHGARASCGERGEGSAGSGDGPEHAHGGDVHASMRRLHLHPTPCTGHMDRDASSGGNAAGLWCRRPVSWVRDLC